MTAWTAFAVATGRVLRLAQNELTVAEEEGVVWIEGAHDPIYSRLVDGAAVLLPAVPYTMTGDAVADGVTECVLTGLPDPVQAILLRQGPPTPFDLSRGEIVSWIMEGDGTATGGTLTLTFTVAGDYKLLLVAQETHRSTEVLFHAT